MADITHAPTLISVTVQPLIVTLQLTLPHSDQRHCAAPNCHFTTHITPLWSASLCSSSLSLYNSHAPTLISVTVQLLSVTLQLTCPHSDQRHCAAPNCHFTTHITTLISVTVQLLIVTLQLTLPHSDQRHCTAPNCHFTTHITTLK